ncbi:MAG: hypothetical protein ACK478_12065, partial [Flavobacteriales bacterium]
MTPTFAAVGPFCSGASIPALPTTSTNGITGTWNPAINNTATTGYTFTPTAGQCATTASLTITIVSPANAGVDAALSLCSSGVSVNLFNYLGAQAQTEGSWSGPSALSGGYLGTFNPTTQQAGVYTYTVSGTTPCPADLAVVTVSINASNTATISYPTPICSGTGGEIAPIITGTAGGTFASTAGLVINASNGFINLDSSSPGSYTVTYSIAASAGCAAFQTTALVDIRPNLFASVSGSGDICSDSNATFNFTGTANSTISFALNGNQQDILLSASGNGTYTVANATSQSVVQLISVSDGTCINSINESAIVNVYPLLEATVSANTPICDGSTAVFTLTGPSNGSVTCVLNGSPRTVNLDGNGTGFVVEPNAYSDQVINLISVSDGTCTNLVFGSAIVNVNPSLEASVSAITPVCNGSVAVFTLTGPSNGNITYSLNGGPLQNVNLDGSGTGIVLEAFAHSDQVITLVSVSNGTCENAISGNCQQCCVGWWMHPPGQGLIG